jgi:hypothetical protein
MNLYESNRPSLRGNILFQHQIDRKTPAMDLLKTTLNVKNIKMKFCFLCIHF